jgi:hypothetical protein
MNDEAAREGEISHGSAMRELVNPLEAANNIAYLLSVSIDDPTASDRYIQMLQGQLAVLNDVVRRALERMKNGH